MVTQPPMPLWTGLDLAESALLELRRSQRGAPTLGDDADQQLLAALADLPHEAAREAHASGKRVGESVYARRFVEDTLPHAVTVLSQALCASGFGSLKLERSFHRSARIVFRSSERERTPALHAFVAGVLEGFFSSAFNCHARARAAPDAMIELELGDGKDVRRRGVAA